MFSFSAQFERSRCVLSVWMGGEVRYLRCRTCAGGRGVLHRGQLSEGGRGGLKLRGVSRLLQRVSQVSVSAFCLPGMIHSLCLFRLSVL